MKLINGKPWIELDNYLDMQSFANMEEQIIYSIAKNSHLIEPSYTPHSTLYNKKQIGYLEQKEKNKLTFGNLNSSQLNWLTRLQGTATLGSHLVLRGIKGYPNGYPYKHLREYSFEMPAHNDFTFLYDWVNNQNCFSEYGRIMFWLNEPNQITAIHTDYGNVSADNRDMFIWLTGKHPKSLLLLDDETKEIHETQSKSLLFDNTNWHGSKGHAAYSSWSLRIDGVFNKEWAAMVGVKEHFNL